MKKEFKLLNKIMKFRNEMRTTTKKKVTKFVGALTLELLRKELIKEGFNVSNRDVFIKGVPYEVDLIVAKKGAKPQEKLLYSPEQVIAVLEIKFSGIYTKSEIESIKRVFDWIKKVNEEIKCIYLTISENTKFKYYKDEKNLIRNSSFFLLSRETDLEKAIKENKLSITGDWDKLINLLKK
jgi:hypothetical protein